MVDVLKKCTPIKGKTFAQKSGKMRVPPLFHPHSCEITATHIAEKKVFFAPNDGVKVLNKSV